MSTETKTFLACPKELVLSATSADFDKVLDFASWCAAGRQLVEMASGVNFWVGDWINFGLRRFCSKSQDTGKFIASDAYKEALKATGLEAETLRHLAWVASAVAAGARSARLSWAHHREVAALPAAKQRSWLKLAEAGDNGVMWTVSQLRMAIRGSQRTINDADERGLDALKWAKPAEDLCRYLKQEDNDDPIERWSAERKRAYRVALAPVKQMVDRLWQDE